MQQSSLGAGPLPDTPGTVAGAGNPAWSDYRAAVTLRSDTDNGIGVVFRCRSDHDYYRFSMNSAANAVAHDHGRRIPVRGRPANSDKVFHELLFARRQAGIGLA